MDHVDDNKFERVNEMIQWEMRMIGRPVFIVGVSIVSSPPLEPSGSQAPAAVTTATATATR